MAKVTFERITDGYCWGRYGTTSIIINTRTDYINITHICGLATNDMGVSRSFSEWRHDGRAVILLAKMMEARGVMPEDVFHMVFDDQTPILGGVYGPAVLARDAASWINMGIELSVNEIIGTYELCGHNMWAPVGLGQKVCDLTAEIASMSINLDRATRQVIQHRAMSAELVERMTYLNNIVEDLVIRHGAYNKYDTVVVIYHKPGTKCLKMIRRQRIALKVGLAAALREGYTICAYYTDSLHYVDVCGRLKRILPSNIGHATKHDITLSMRGQVLDLMNFIRGQ